MQKTAPILVHPSRSNSTDNSPLTLQSGSSRPSCKRKTRPHRTANSILCVTSTLVIGCSPWSLRTSFWINIDKTASAVLPSRIARRFIGQQQLRLPSPVSRSQAHPLLLAPAQLARPMIRPHPQPHFVQPHPRLVQLPPPHVARPVRSAAASRRSPAAVAVRAADSETARRTPLRDCETPPPVVRSVGRTGESLRRPARTTQTLAPGRRIAEVALARVRQRALAPSALPHNRGTILSTAATSKSSPRNSTTSPRPAPHSPARPARHRRIRTFVSPTARSITTHTRSTSHPLSLLCRSPAPAPVPAA